MLTFRNHLLLGLDSESGVRTRTDGPSQSLVCIFTSRATGTIPAYWCETKAIMTGNAKCPIGRISNLQNIWLQWLDMATAENSMKHHIQPWLYTLTRPSCSLFNILVNIIGARFG